MMFATSNPQKMADKIIGKLSKELGLASPPQSEVETEGQFRPNSIGQALGDLGASLFGGRARPLHTVRVDVSQPRPFELRAHVIKAGSATALGSLLYSIKLSKSVTSTVTLEPEKTFSKSKFTGDGAVAEKLNASAPLIKQVNGFVRTEYQVGDEKVKTERFLKLEPFEGGSLLTINTLPKSKWLGLSSNLDAKAFLDVASAIEGAL